MSQENNSGTTTISGNIIAQSITGYGTLRVKKGAVPPYAIAPTITVIWEDDSPSPCHYFTYPQNDDEPGSSSGILISNETFDDGLLGNCFLPLDAI